MLNKDEVLKRANELYAEKKVAKHGESYRNSKMQTDTAVSIIEALVEAVNARIYP